MTVSLRQILLVKSNCVPARKKAVPRKKRPTLSDIVRKLRHRLLRLFTILSRRIRRISRDVSRLAGQVNAVSAQEKQLAAQLAQTNQSLNGLSGQVSALAARTEPFAAQIADLQGEVESLYATSRAVRTVLQGRVGTTVSLDTNAGSISGTLTVVGDDFAQIQEPTGDIVLIPLANVNSVT
ncbi:hypothetical protein QJ48_34225 [Paenibacillus sp. A3]|uniref:hypothetical protein n=1 Tax=Paenibacillus sp. A3 TaxID=1337054 RepID=UPI0006D59604|nr:hypothetical protein [Paenibacillus sp. A3]KPV55242.1 hypothetical protein QJ48_34225 [Paenibacillus sp. A3]